MSAIQTFKRCSKKYEIQYKKLLDGVKESPALETGRAFHKIMEEYTKGVSLYPQDTQGMEYVAWKYLQHRPLPDKENVLFVEEPIYVQILPGVYVRCTMDLVYREGNNIVICDYKTFSRMPSLDTDLDFQARVYIALLSQHLGNENIVFRHEYVRTTPPNVPKDKAGNSWSPEECYFRTEVVIGEREKNTILEELRFDLKVLQQTEFAGVYTRNNIKGGGYMDCSNCSVKELCKAELQHGSLDLIDLTYLAVPREPIELPEGLKA